MSTPTSSFPHLFCKSRFALFSPKIAACEVNKWSKKVAAKIKTTNSPKNRNLCSLNAHTHTRTREFEEKLLIGVWDQPLHEWWLRWWSRLCVSLGKMWYFYLRFFHSLSVRSWFRGCFSFWQPAKRRNAFWRFEAVWWFMIVWKIYRLLTLGFKIFWIIGINIMNLTCGFVSVL